KKKSPAQPSAGDFSEWPCQTASSAWRSCFKQFKVSSADLVPGIATPCNFEHICSDRSRLLRGKCLSFANKISGGLKVARLAFCAVAVEQTTMRQHGNTEMHHFHQ